jgi:hypothetical protein
MRIAWRMKKVERYTKPRTIRTPGVEKSLVRLEAASPAPKRPASRSRCTQLPAHALAETRDVCSVVWAVPGVERQQRVERERSIPVGMVELAAKVAR